MAPEATSNSKQAGWIPAIAKLAVLPLLLSIGLLTLSPNFRLPAEPESTTLDHPLGGDYVQEYVGGRLLLSDATKHQLYDPESFEAAQHDPAIVGFRWNEQQFFPAVYPPAWYAAVSPLSRLEYRTAMRCWLAVNVLLLLAALVLLHRFDRIPIILLSVLCLGLPVIESLNSGQKGTWLLLILTASFLLQRSNRPLLSGLVFALLTFKPHLCLAIGLFMLLSGHWRWVIGSFGGLAIGIAACYATGGQLAADYVRVILGFGDYVQSGGYDLHKSFSLWSFWQHLISSTIVAKVLTAVSTVAVFAATFWLLLSRLRESRTSQRPGRAKKTVELTSNHFAALVLLTIVTSLHLYVYDLTLLILPITLLIRDLFESTKQRQWQSWLPVILLLAVYFGSEALTTVAQVTHFNAGVIVLLAALWLTVRPLDQAALATEPTAFDAR